jgi:hypothetical protein
MTMHGIKVARDVAMPYWEITVVMLAKRLCNRDAVMDVS